MFIPVRRNLALCTSSLLHNLTTPRTRTSQELPGYGFSSLPSQSDKRTVGGLIMEALQQVFGKDRPVIWCGHDRGARVGHRLLVDNKSSHNILHAILMVTNTQHSSISNPTQKNHPLTPHTTGHSPHPNPMAQLREPESIARILPLAFPRNEYRPSDD